MWVPKNFFDRMAIFSRNSDAAFVPSDAVVPSDPVVPGDAFPDLLADLLVDAPLDAPLSGCLPVRVTP